MRNLRDWIIRALENFGPSDDRKLIAALREKFAVAESTVRWARLELVRRGTIERCGWVGRRRRAVWRLAK
jgi:hypothetical protein